jgi:Fe-S-cluster containining protein
MTKTQIPGFVKFNCTRCGKCCQSLGRHIRIERKTGERDYYCRDLLSNNLVTVHIEAPYLPVFKERSGPGGADAGLCPFLIQTPEGYACAVYSTRPLVCREFQCCRMRIFSPGGVISGTIKGRRSLTTEDQSLQVVWNTRISPFKIENDGQWDNTVKHILESAGYIVELYR